MYAYPEDEENYENMDVITITWEFVSPEDSSKENFELNIYSCIDSQEQRTLIKIVNVKPLMMVIPHIL